MPLWEIELEGGQIIELDSENEPTDEQVYAALKQPTQTATPQTNLGTLMAQWPQPSQIPAAPGMSPVPFIPPEMIGPETPQQKEQRVMEETWAGLTPGEKLQMDLARGGRATVEGAALTAKGVGVLGSVTPPTFMGEGDIIPGSRAEQNLQDWLERRRTMTPEEKRAVVTENPMYGLGERISAWNEKAFPEVQPQSVDRPIGAVLEGVGSTVSMAPFGLGGPAGIALAGALQNGAAAYEEAVAKGADANQAENVFLLNALGGTSEAVPIAHIFQRINRMGGGSLTKALRDVVVSGFEEGAQETFQQLWQNLSAKYLYDDERNLMEGVVQSGAVGSGTGIFLTALGIGVRGAAARAVRQKGGEQHAREKPGAARVSEPQVRPRVGEAPSLRPEGQAAQARPQAEAAPVMSVEDQIIELENDPEVTGQKLVRMDEAGNPVYEGVYVNDRKKRKLEQLKDLAFGMPAAMAPVVQEAEPEFELTEKQNNSARTLWESGTDEGQGRMVGDRLDLVGAKWEELTQEEKHYLALQTGAKRPKGGKQAVLERLHLQPAAAEIKTEQDVENFVNELTTLRELRDRKAANSRQMGRLARMENVQGIGKLNAEDARYVLRERLAIQNEGVTVRGGHTPQIRISDEQDPNSPFSPARISKGTGAASADTFAVWDKKTNSILINAGRMANWRAGLRRIGYNEVQILRAFQTMVAHEVLHGQTDPAAAEPFWVSMTKVEQEVFKRRYALGGPVPEMSDHLWGMEALAYRQAQAMNMTPVEFTQMTLNERIGWGTLDILERVFRAIRERLTTAGREHLRLLEKAFNNIRAAKEEVRRSTAQGEMPSGPVRPAITEENIDDLNESQYRSMKHNDGIAYGVTLTEEDVPRLESGYAKWTEAIPKAYASGDESAIMEAFGKSIFYGGALQGATKGKHKVAAGNYDIWASQQMAELPSGPVRRIKTPKETPEQIKAKYEAAMKLKAEGGAMTPEDVTKLRESVWQPITPAAIPQTVVNFVQQSNDVSLSEFAKFFRKTHGPVEEAQLRQALADNIGNAMMQMPGAKLADVLKEMGLVKQMFGGGTGTVALRALDKLPPLASQERKPRKIGEVQTLMKFSVGDPKQELPNQWKIERSIVRELERRGYEQKGRPGIRTQQKAIAEIMHEIFFQTSDAAQGLFRKEISPEHMADPTKFDNVFARIPRYQQKDTILGEALADKGRTSGRNVEDSKRLVVLRNDKTGKIDVVSIWNEQARRGVLVRSPTATAESPVPFETVLKTHSPIFTILMYRPLRRFHKSYANEADFMAAFGDEAKNIIQTTISEAMPGEYMQTGLQPMGAGEEELTGVAMKAVPGEMISSPGLLTEAAEEDLAEAERVVAEYVKAGRMTETEAKLALYYMRKPDLAPEPAPIKETGAMTGPNTELGRALLGIGPQAIRLGHVTDAELAEVYRHLENNHFSSPTQLIDAIDAIRDLSQEVPITELPLQFISGISKMLKRIYRSNPDFNDIEGLQYLGQHLYELYTQSKTESGRGRSGFVQRALESYRREPPIPGTPVAARAAPEPGISVLQRGEPARYRDPLGRPIVNPPVERLDKILEQVKPGPGRTQEQTLELANQVLQDYLKDRESSRFERMLMELSPEKIGREALKEIKDEVPRKRGESRDRWMERVREHYASDVTWKSIQEGAITGAELLKVYRQAAWQAQFGEILESESGSEEETPSGPVRQALTTGVSSTSLPFKAVIAGIRWGSEWMVDRLRRVTPAHQLKAQAILANINNIISRQSRLSGRMFADFGDAMLRAAGKNDEGVRWMNDVQPIIPFVGGVSNAVEAIEGRIHPPDSAVEINTMAQEVNLLIGNEMEPVSPGFIANGGMSRMSNAFGYDVIRIGRGKNFENLVKATAVANKLPIGTVKAKFKKLSRLLNSPNPDMAAMFKINQDFIRTMPNVVTHIWTGPKNRMLGHWEPVVHADLFDYFNHGIRRAAMIKAFRETYPIAPRDPITGKRKRVGADMRKDIQALREAAGSKWNGLINAVYRTLQGHPSENMVQTGFRIPVSIAEPGGFALRILSPIGNVIRTGWLTKQFVLQPAELLSGGSVIFFGLRRSAMATLRHKELYPMMEYNGTVDRIIYNNSWNRNSPIRSAFRIYNNNVQRWTGQNLFNELQEAQAAGAAEFAAEKIRDANTSGSGVKLTWSERHLLPQTFRAMGFNAREVNDMMRGHPILLAQMVRRAASFLSGGHAHPVESSRMLANRDFQKLFWFQRYPATRTNQVMKILGLIFEHRKNGDYKQMADATLLLLRFGGFAANQGLIQTMMIAGFTGGLFALGIKLKEWDDEPFAMLVDSFRSAIGGPFQLVTKGYEDGGMLNVANNLKRMSAPYNIMGEMWDLANGTGLYKDLDVTDRIAAYLNRNIPMTRASKTAAAWVGLSTYDSNLEEAQKALNRWKLDKWPRMFGTQDEWKDDQSSKFRVQIKKAVEALKRGDDEGQLEAMAAAVDYKIEEGKSLEESAQAVRSSFSARRRLKNPQTNADLTVEELDELEARIGSAAMNKLEDFDLMLKHAAGEGE